MYTYTHVVTCVHLYRYLGAPCLNQETKNWFHYINQKMRALPFGFSHEEYYKKEPGRVKQRENSVPISEAEEYDQLERLTVHACTTLHIGQEGKI